MTILRWPRMPYLPWLPDLTFRFGCIDFMCRIIATDWGRDFPWEPDGNYWQDVALAQLTAALWLRDVPDQIDIDADVAPYFMDICSGDEFNLTFMLCLRIGNLPTYCNPLISILTSTQSCSLRESNTT